MFEGGDLAANIAPHAALATFGGVVRALSGIGGALAATCLMSSSALTSESVVEVCALDSDSEEEESEREVGDDAFAGVVDDAALATRSLLFLPFELLAVAEVVLPVAGLATVGSTDFLALFAAFRSFCDMPVCLMTAHIGIWSDMGPKAKDEVLEGCGKQ